MSERSRWLHRFAWFTLLATLLLICSGGMVTSKGVGLAVPDWPTTFGYNMFLFPVSKWVGGILFEHTHRLIASTVGFLTIILAGMTLSQLIEEKSNKVIEVLAAAVPIEAIFVGKLFAMLAASIVGIVVWVSTGVAAVSMLTAGGAGEIPTPAVGSGPFLILTVIYFAMNYLLLGSVFLSIGAQASTVREVQTLSMPVTVAQVLIFGFAALAIGSPDSPIAIGGALFPLSSPLVMVFFSLSSVCLIA